VKVVACEIPRNGDVVFGITIPQIPRISDAPAGPICMWELPEGRYLIRRSLRQESVHHFVLPIDCAPLKKFLRGNRGSIYCSISYCSTYQTQNIEMLRQMYEMSPRFQIDQPYIIANKMIENLEMPAASALSIKKLPNQLKTPKQHFSYALQHVHRWSKTL
jgi:hypothetical protein